MITFQDYERAKRAGESEGFLAGAIAAHVASEPYRMAVVADAYDRQRNLTVNNYTKFMAEHGGSALQRAAAANNRIPSNFFHQLNVQRCAYLLGNGVSFVGDAKARLGSRFDRDFYELGRLALIHGECFAHWNGERLVLFPLTQFMPFYDEHTGALRAGIRFWRLDADRPTHVVVYEEDGVAEYAGAEALALVRGKQPYLVRGTETRAGGFEAAGAANYPALPVIRLCGSGLRQSTLCGMREKIDAYDLIQSGFANDLMDCAQIYWIIENCGGMREGDLRAFLNRLGRDHVAVADTRGMGAEAGALKPYVQEVPFESRMAWLNFIRASIYEGFGALDVRALSAGHRTATEIDAAYQPLDEAADDFEAQCTDAIAQLLNILGLKDEPLYKRNRVANVYEQTRTVMLARGLIDDETLVRHLPWLTIDEAGKRK